MRGNKGEPAVNAIALYTDKKSQKTKIKKEEEKRRCPSSLQLAFGEADALFQALRKALFPQLTWMGGYWFRAGMRVKGAPQVLWAALVTLWSILKGSGHWVTASNSFSGLIPYLQLFPRSLLLALSGFRHVPTELNLQHLYIALWQWRVLSSNIVIKRFWCKRLGRSKKLASEIV